LFYQPQDTNLRNVLKART